MSLPTKDELLKEIVAVIEGTFEAMSKELEEEAKKLKGSYFKRIEEVCSSVSL